MLDAFESSKRSDGSSLSVAEYIRLLQIYEELAENDSRPVTVRWIDQWEPAKTG